MAIPASLEPRFSLVRSKIGWMPLGQRFGWMIGEENAKGVVVVDRYPGVAAQVGKFRLRWHQRIKRHHELVDAPVEFLVAKLPLRRDAHAKLLTHAFERRPQVPLGEPGVDLALGI